MAAKKIGRPTDSLKDIGLSPEEYKKFEEMENLQAQSGTIEDVDLFEYGFGMAVLMMIEVFSFKDRRLTERESE